MGGCLMDGPDGDMMGSRAGLWWAQAQRLPCSSLPLGEAPSASNLSQQPRRPTSCMDGTPPWKTFGTRARGVESSTSPDRAPVASAASPRNALGLPEPARRLPQISILLPILAHSSPRHRYSHRRYLSDPRRARRSFRCPVSLSRPCNSRAVLIWNEMKWPPPAPRLDIA